MARRAKPCPRITPFGTWLKDYPRQQQLILQTGAPATTSRLIMGGVRHLLSINRPIIESITRHEGLDQAAQIIATLIMHDRDLRVYLTGGQVSAVALAVAEDFSDMDTVNRSVC